MTAPVLPAASAAYAAAISLAQAQAGQSALTRSVVALVARAIRKWGVPTSARERDRFARRIYPQVRLARAQSWMLAARHMQETMPIAVAPVREYPVQAIATAIEDAVDAADEAERRREDARVSAVPAERVVEESPPPTPVRVPTPASKSGEPQKSARVTVADSGESQTKPTSTVNDAGDQQAKPRSRVTVTAPETPAEPRPRARARVTVSAPETPRQPRVSVRELDQISRSDAESRSPKPREDVVAKELGATLARHVHAAGRDAVRDTADESGEEIGWARILSGNESCAFCAMLASRGPVYKNEYIATHKGGISGDPYHNNCVVPGTWVSGPDTEVGYRRHYEGEIVTLVTAAGHELSITPNHPVLTDRGWVPAGLLDVGDKLVSAVSSQWNVVGGPHVDHVPARIEDVVGALGMVSTAVRRRVPGSAEQFHGDGFASEVDVVSGHDLLGDDVDAALVKPPAELYLHRASTKRSVRGLAETGLGGLEQLVGSSDSAGYGGVRGGGLFGALTCGHSLSAVLASGASASEFYAGLSEPACDDGAGDVVVGGERQYGCAVGVTTGYVGGRINPVGHAVGVTRKFDPPMLHGGEKAGRVFAELGADLRVRLAGSVHFDDLVDKRVGVYHGPVLNLATREGWYSANSITVSNCDCDAVLVRKGEPWEGEQEAADLEDLWVEATKGFYGKHARNAFRRAVEEARRDGLSWPEMVERLKAQRKATKQELVDAKAWLAAEKKWKTTTIAGLKRIDDDRDLSTPQGRRLRANANVVAVNPEYVNGRLEWRINCQRCVQALELRDRGYDVQAMPNFDPSPSIAKKKWSKQILDTPPFPMDMTDSQRKQLLEIMYPDKKGYSGQMRNGIALENYANQWRQADGSRREFQQASKNELLSTLQAMPIGSRGWVTTRWKKGGAHIFSWQVVEDAAGNSVMRFVDPQTGSLDASGHLDLAKPDRIAWMRVDDLHPVDAVREMIAEA